MWDLIVSVPDHCLSFYFDTHMGKLLIYCIHQLQADRIYLFPYFSSFFCVSN